MLGGADEDVDAVLTLVRAMGDKYHRLGPLGSGMRVKVLNNSVAAASVVAVRRALADAERAGVGAATLLDVMRGSSGATWFGDAFERVSWAHEGYAPDNTVGILVKDVRAGIESAGRDPDGWDAALIEALGSLTPMVPASVVADGAVAVRTGPRPRRRLRPGLRQALVIAPERLDRAGPVRDGARPPRGPRAPLARGQRARVDPGRLRRPGPGAAGRARGRRRSSAAGRCASTATGSPSSRRCARPEPHARRGVGTALLGALLAEARVRGATRVALETGTGPAFEPALAFYARHGFESLRAVRGLRGRSVLDVHGARARSGGRLVAEELDIEGAFGRELCTLDGKSPKARSVRRP